MRSMGGKMVDDDTFQYCCWNSCMIDSIYTQTSFCCFCTASDRSLSGGNPHAFIPAPSSTHTTLPYPLHVSIISFLLPHFPLAPLHFLPYFSFPLLSLSPQFDADVLGCNRYSSSGRVVAIDTWNPSPPRRTNILDSNQVGRSPFCPIRTVHLASQQEVQLLIVISVYSKLYFCTNCEVSDHSAWLSCV